MNSTAINGLLILISVLTLSILSFAQNAAFSYVYPLDESSNLNPEQNIILKCLDGINSESISSGSISITGSKSGSHSYSFSISEDARTVIFMPITPFMRGEKVEVRYMGDMTSSPGDQFMALDFQFRIIDHDRDEVLNLLERLQEPEDEQAYQPESEKLFDDSFMDNNLPDDYPPMTVFNYGEHDDEYFFLNTVCRNASLPWEKYITIIDSYGTPVYYNKSEFNRHNFSMLTNGFLCYANTTMPNSEREKYFLMDSTFTIVDSVNTGNGYILDSHDMLLLSNGHYLVMSYDPQPVDMSQVVPGGDPNAIVTGLVIQEVDNNENVFFQWRSWDHFEITDATSDINMQASTIDYVHGNAFEIDVDGHILVSSRNLDEITKIDYNTGDVIWRFGLNCENNMFQILNDPHGFSHQHDIRLLSNGHYSVYNNGNLNIPQVSNALEYSINQNTMVASLEWSWQHPTQNYASSTGSFRTLENGNRVIGWGGTWPLAVTVLDDDDEILQQIFMPDFVISYRALKYHWETNAFKSQDILSMGNYAGYSGWKMNKLYVFNTSSKMISITSIHHHTAAFEVFSDFPVSIFPGSYKSIEIGFNPSMQNGYDDRFTLNFDNADNTERIAIQLTVKGFYDDETPSVMFDPEHGSTNISPDHLILINFSESVKKIFGGDILNEDIKDLVEFREEYYDGNEVSFTGTINDVKNQITIVPDQMLLESQQYYLKLKGNMIVDEDENIIKLDEECYFSTGLLIGMPESSYDQVQVYPNPFKETLLITNPGGSSSTIQIFNTQGQVVRNFQSSEASVQVHLSDQQSGIYFIRISNNTGENTRTFKLIKH